MSEGGIELGQPTVAVAPGGATPSPELPASFFRTVIETANEGIWMIDCEGRTIFANDRMAKMLGITPGEMIGRHPREFLVAGDLGMASLVIRETLAGHPQQFEPRFYRANGSELPALGGTAPIRDEFGNIVGAVATFSDLSAYKAAEQALRDSERQANATASLLNQLLEAATDAIWMRDVGGVFRVANPAACRVMGEQESDVIGHSVHEIWGDDVGDHLVRETQEILALGHGITVEEEMFDRGRGGKTIFLSNKVPIYSADGSALGILGVSRDITERKRHWNELKESRAQLAQQVLELQAAQQREQLLAREVDHRAKNLLAVVQSVVQLTRADSADELKKGLTGRIQALANAHALLADSRWDGVELSQLVADEMAPFAGGALPQVTFDGPGLRLSPAAAQSLALVLHELATNAAKYGALVTSNGRLSIGWKRLDEPSGSLVLEWIETTPDPVREPSSLGFGSRIIRASVERQLRGRVTQRWLKSGLHCTLEVPLSSAAVKSEP